MKYTIAILSSLSLICLLAIQGCTPKSTNSTTGTTTTIAGPISGAKIAYVNLDSLEAKYELLKTRREQFRAKQEQMEGELQRSFQLMEGDAMDVQKKAQAGTLTEAEYNGAKKRLEQMQRSLETRKQALTEQLMKEQNDFNKDLKTRLDAFLETYNKDKQYDYILSYSEAGSSLLYVNKALDITKDVVDGMNASTKSDDNNKNK